MPRLMARADIAIADVLVETAGGGNANSHRCPTNTFGSSIGVSDMPLAGQNARTPPTITSNPPRLYP